MLSSNVHHALLTCCALLGPTGAALAGPQSIPTDLVFLVDDSSSMGQEIGAVRQGVAGFAQALAQAQIDARFALVSFGCRPRLVLDLTADASALDGALGSLSATQGSPEAGLEAVRMALGVAPQPFQQPPPGSDGRLHFRPGALVNLIVITDEDSDVPYHAANRFSGQPNPACTCVVGSCGEASQPSDGDYASWQAEIDATASAVLAQGAYVNLVVDSTVGSTLWQYGSPFATQLDPQGHFDRAATFAVLSNLQKKSLQGRVLEQGGLARAFSLALIAADLDHDGVSDLVEQLFATKVEETLLANLPPVFVLAPQASCGTGASPLLAPLGQSLSIDLQASAPEAGQTTSIALAPGTPANVALTTTPGSTASARLTFTPDASQVGDRTLRIVATDDGLPQLSTTLELCVRVEGSSPFAPYCYGSGCPCQNDDPSGSGGCANSTGSGGRLAWSGGASLAAADLALRLEGLPQRTFSILFAGSATTLAPFGQGLACVAPGPQRMPSPPWGFGLARLGGGASTGGTLAVSGVVPALEQAFGPLMVGQTVYLQGYYRNPVLSCPNDPTATFNFTNALGVSFEP